MIVDARRSIGPWWYAIAMVLAGLGPWVTATAQQAGVPEDRSLTSSEYVERGLPAADRPWSGEEMKLALKGLAAIAKEDPAKLPRAKSPRSGVVFGRLTDSVNHLMAKNAKLPVGSRLVDTLGYQQSMGLIAGLYLDAFQKQAVGDTEMIDVLGHTLRTTEVLLPLLDEFVASLPPDDPQREIRLTGLKQVKGGLAMQFSGSLITLEERDAYRPSERVRLIDTLKDVTPAFVPWFTADSRTEFLARLEKLAADPKNADLQPSLDRLHNSYVKTVEATKEEKPSLPGTSKE